MSNCFQGNIICYAGWSFPCLFFSFSHSCSSSPLLARDNLVSFSVSLFVTLHTPILTPTINARAFAKRQSNAWSSHGSVMFRFGLSNCCRRDGLLGREMLRVEYCNNSKEKIMMTHPEVSSGGLWLSRWRLCIEVGLSRSSAAESYMTRHLGSASGTGCKDQD